MFAVTSIFSLWAYIWLWMCVTDNYISITEAFVTCAFFIILLVISYTADRVNKFRVNQRMGHEEQIEKAR